MTIIEMKGNLLTANADALVNTINTDGVMGKGLALQFARAYPDMLREYRNACVNGDVRVGRMHIWFTGAQHGLRFIVNFPTKDSWRNPSHIEFIEEGLKDLVAQIRRLKIISIAIPPLGCGLGGLKWDDVYPLIIDAFELLGDIDVLVYPPN